MNHPSAFSLKSLQIVHLALVAGLIVMTALIVFLNMQRVNREQIDEAVPFIVVGAVSALLNLLLSKIVFSKQVSSVKTLQSLDDKLYRFRQAFLTKMALLEGAGIFNVIVTFLTGSYITLAFALVIVIAMYFQKPTKFSVTEALGLSPDESARLEEV